MSSDDAGTKMKQLTVLVSGAEIVKNHLISSIESLCGFSRIRLPAACKPSYKQRELIKMLLRVHQPITYCMCHSEHRRYSQSGKICNP